MDLTAISDNMFSALDTTSIRSSMANTALTSGITLMQGKKYKQAAQVFRMAVNYDPTNTDAYNYMAQANLKAGDSKSAINAYKLSIQILSGGQSTATSGTTKDQVQIDLANIYIQEKRPIDAIKELQAAVKTNPQNTIANYTLGQILVQQNRPQEAEGYFRKTVKLSPQDGNAYYGLGLSLEKQGKNDDAIKAMQKAMTLKKDFSAAMYELGNLYANTGQTDKIQALIDNLKKINTSESITSADELSVLIEKPKMIGVNAANSSFKASLSTIYGKVQLTTLDTGLNTSGASKDFTMKFFFDSNMDASSVTDVSKWSITKARGGTAGIYENGLYRPTDIPVPILPKSVSYNPATSEATVVFTLSQNNDKNGTIDPSHVVFKFMGKDAKGKVMDSSADEYDAFAKVPF